MTGQPNGRALLLLTVVSLIMWAVVVLLIIRACDPAP